MRIGLAPAGSRDAATAVEMARLAEQNGLDEVWLSEDYLERGAFSVAGGVAAVTSTVRIGLGVINPWTRHVALTAMECAALDELAGGRLTVGVGAASAVTMQGMLGIPFDKPIARMLEYCQALRELLAGERIDREVLGQQMKAGLAFTPRRKDVPLYIGVKGPVALAKSAPFADGLMLSILSSPDYVSWIRETYQPRAITAYVSVSYDEDRQVARDRVRARTAFFLGIHGATAITEKAGLDPALCALFRERFLAGVDATELVTDEVLDAVTLSGTIDDCVNGFRRFAEAGLDSLVVIDHGFEDAATAVEKIAAIVARV